MSVNARGCPVVVAAPSGAGKTSLVRALAEIDTRVRLSVSYTTRQARPGEHDGEHYHFIDSARFEALIGDDALVEHALVHGNYYGTGRDKVEEALAAGFDVILEIDWQGARQVRKLWPDALSIFVLPPSKEALLQRLTHRGQDSNAVIARRLANAKAEIEHHAEFDYLLINDDFAHSLADLTAILRAHRQHSSRQTKAHEALIQTLLQE